MLQLQAPFMITMQSLSYHHLLLLDVRMCLLRPLLIITKVWSDSKTKILLKLSKNSHTSSAGDGPCNQSKPLRMLRFALPDGAQYSSIHVSTTSSDKSKKQKKQPMKKIVAGSTIFIPVMGFNDQNDVTARTYEITVHISPCASKYLVFEASTFFVVADANQWDSPVCPAVRSPPIKVSSTEKVDPQYLWCRSRMLLILAYA